eukprot:2347092-Rhodomonas_salina.1
MVWCEDVLRKRKRGAMQPLPGLGSLSQRHVPGFSPEISQLETFEPTPYGRLKKPLKKRRSCKEGSIPGYTTGYRGTPGTPGTRVPGSRSGSVPEKEGSLFSSC